MIYTATYLKANPCGFACDFGRIRLGNFVEHFDSVEHISYSTGTSRNSVEHKRCQEKCL